MRLNISKRPLPGQTCFQSPLISPHLSSVHASFRTLNATFAPIQRNSLQYFFSRYQLIIMVTSSSLSGSYCVVAEEPMRRTLASHSSTCSYPASCNPSIRRESMKFLTCGRSLGGTFSVSHRIGSSVLLGIEITEYGKFFCAKNFLKTSICAFLNSQTLPEDCVKSDVLLLFWGFSGIVIRVTALITGSLCAFLSLFTYPEPRTFLIAMRYLS